MKTKTKGIIAAVSVVAVICLIVLFWLFGTESGKRSIKNMQSNISGGIERVVRIYDVNGELIEKYEGKFDVEYDSDRILFDDENGKRHVIYYSTATVIIDEK